MFSRRRHNHAIPKTKHAKTRAETKEKVCREHTKKEVRSYYERDYVSRMTKKSKSRNRRSGNRDDYSVKILYLKVKAAHLHVKLFVLLVSFWFLRPFWGLPPTSKDLQTSVSSMRTYISWQRNCPRCGSSLLLRSKNCQQH